MRYRYFLCDVFTGTPFGGNPLAVLPDARGLSDGRMQQIAREFNFSESTFVLPAEAGHTRRVRIFTPTMEVPFAGHPNVGTAFALASAGELGSLDSPVRATFEEKAGLVEVTIERREGGVVWCEIAAPERLSLGTEVDAAAVAAAVSLSPADVVTRPHPPRVASVGLPFLLAEVASRDALARARINEAGLDALVARGVTPDIHLWFRSGDDFDIRARMFAPRDLVPEDPATGSANGALGAMLSQGDCRADGTWRWRIAQGVEMGRPSVLEVRTDKKDGVVVSTRIGGASVLMGEGWIEVP